FGLRPIIVPDLAALDGSRKGISALALGGTSVEDIRGMADSEFTIVIGAGMKAAARILEERFGIEYRVFDSIAGLNDTDILMKALSALSAREMSARYERRRSILIDGMRDAHFYFGGKKACLALDPDHSVQMSRLLDEAGVTIAQAVVPHMTESVSCIVADQTAVGDLNSIRAECDIIISNSHASESALRLQVPLYQTGFPVHKLIGVTARVTIGYTGTLNSINDIGNLLMKAH
ncbi:MAG TPA: nitrogenase component 1, partial [Dissulfurispiraceae bacterium]|nr:nitrogenase component 1 [Dissulfurispiraceae bacterium]